MLNEKCWQGGWVGILAGILAASPGAQPPNALSPAESTAVYDLLFNGSDLDAWQDYRGTKVTAGWAVKADEPLGPRIENGPGTVSIVSDGQYTNFELKIDVYVPENGSSGKLIRYEEVARSVDHSASGPAFHVCGPRHPNCRLQNMTFGSYYDMFPVAEPLLDTWYDVRSWNQVRIFAFDSNYVHFGNGRKLLEYKIGAPDFLTAYSVSRYAHDGNNGRYHDIHPGGFLLLHWGEVGIAYRNIKAKELAGHPLNREFADIFWPDSLPQEFVFGGPATASPDKGIRTKPNYRSRRSASGETLVEFRSRPSNMRAVGLDGRSFTLEETGAGIYAIRLASNRQAVIFLRFNAGGTTNSGFLILN